MMSCYSILCQPREALLLWFFGLTLLDGGLDVFPGDPATQNPPLARERFRPQDCEGFILVLVDAQLFHVKHPFRYVNPTGASRCAGA